MNLLIVQGDARCLPLADESVDLVVTSPPYWRLRRYADRGKVFPGQVGLEESWEEYVTALLNCTQEWLRVLKRGGSLFVNVGDRYGPGGSLIGIPWRYAIATADLGLVCRAEIVWSKRNPLPEPTRNRVRRTHEHVFHFARPGDYYASLDVIRQPNTMRPQRRPNGRCRDATARPAARQAWSMAARDVPAADGNPLGKIPGSVWDIPTVPLRLPAHLDSPHRPPAFPPALVRPLILGWCPPGGVVADPFGGTGTTALVAALTGRHGISVDMSSSCCGIAQWRSQEPGERAKAAPEEKIEDLAM